MTQEPPKTPSDIDVLIVAAGRGTRAKTDGPKQWQPLHGRRVIDWSLAAFAEHPRIRQCCLVLHPDDLAHAPDGVMMVEGGATRQASVKAGLSALAGLPVPPKWVLIHDGARPCASRVLIDGVIARLCLHGGAAPGTPVTDTLWHAPQERGHKIAQVVPRGDLFAAQTPQGFDFDAIYHAHQKFADHPVTDDVSLALMAGLEVTISAGESDNLKITHPEDFVRAKEVLIKHGF